MAPLQIARVDDEGMLVQDLGPMDVAEGPLVISVVHELLQRARRVPGVRPLPAFARGVQHPDIE